MNGFRPWIILGLIIALVSSVPGCAGKKGVPTPEERAKVTADSLEAARLAKLKADSLAAAAARAKAVADSLAKIEAAKRMEQEAMAAAVLNDIHFDFDKYNIRTDAQPVITENGQVLSKFPKISITIEGHCDERGTNEYNLALGERRAAAAQDWLINYGISANRIRTVSYGEERPIAMGHDETAWAQNRRAHFAKELP
jgi:peptidoglycan-associated lipoprotein